MYGAAVTRTPASSVRHASHRLRGLIALSLVVPFTVAACVTITDTGPAASGGAPGQTAGATAGASSSVATPTPRPTPEPTPEPLDAVVFGFLPYWLAERAAEALDPSLLTTVTWHGVEASGDGRIVSKKSNGDIPPGWAGMETEAFDQLKQRLQAAGVEVALTVQRFGWTDGAAKRTKNLLTDRKDRRKLADRIAALVAERGFDGVNLDFEPMPADLADEYAAFVREVRAALDAVEPGQHLSVDVHPSLTGYDLAALTADDAADLAILMAYEYRGAGAGLASSIAPLSDPATNDIESTVAAALEQVEPGKLVLGLPWYGRAWSTETPDGRSATLSGRDIDAPATVSYALAVEQAELFGRRYQPDQASAWTVYPTQSCSSCDAVWRQVWYDDPDSFGAKIDLAVEQGLGGVGMWALGHEDGREELWWALRNKIQQRADDAPPNGNAALDTSASRRERDGIPVVSGSVPLRLIASDAGDGTGLGYVRVGLAPELDGRDRLTTGRTYPATESLEFALGDPATGGSAEDGPRAVHVQWRDLAGNWSAPIVIDVWVEDPDPAPSLAQGS